MGRPALSKAPGEAGFTLVELLSAMLIVGLLAAIAVPAFFGQSEKARDAAAKAAAKTAQTAIETYAVDSDGGYAGATPAGLSLIEPTLSDADLVLSAEDGSGAPAAKDYRVTVSSDTGNRFWIARATGSTTVLGCSAAGRAGCPSDGLWG